VSVIVHRHQSVEPACVRRRGGSVALPEIGAGRGYRGAFAFVFCYPTLHHSPDPAPVAVAHRVLAGGGLRAIGEGWMAGTETAIDTCRRGGMTPGDGNAVVRAGRSYFVPRAASGMYTVPPIAGLIPRTYRPAS
jgi:hypothetical protein